MDTTIRDNWWITEFIPSDGDVDYVSRDGKTAVDVRRTSYGSRDLYSTVLQLAILLSRNPKLEHGCLVLNQTRMSIERLKDDWASSIRTFQPRIGRRLHLIVIKDGKSWIDPDEPYCRRIAQVFESAFADDNQSQAVMVGRHPGQKFYEVVKLLIDRWLQRLNAMPIGELSRAVGCSYPTVRQSLSNPSLRDCVRFTSNRSVELRAFPREAWSELLALSPKLRPAYRFQDRSGDKPTAEGLLRRLEKTNPPNLALGGVMAARHWHPDFDLHGTPRLDLAFHAPNSEVDLSFVRRLDPALVQVVDSTTSTVLAIHPVVRATSRFSDNPNGNLPFADPVETALDLNDLSLTAQANQLLTFLRPEVRRA